MAFAGHRLWRRVALIGGAALSVGVIALVLRTLSAGGSFVDVAPGFAGTCRVVIRLPVADIAVDGTRHVAFLAVRGRHGIANADGIYALRLGLRGAEPIRLAGTPVDFHPVALALSRGAGGALMLYAANRRATKFGSIDVFTVDQASGTPVLKEVASVGSSLFADVTAIAVSGGGRFYAAVDPPARTDFFSLLAGYLRPSQGEIVYFDGQVPRVVAKDLRLPRGVALSPDRSKLYLADGVGRALRLYDVQPLSGRLDPAGTYPLAIAPSHLSLDGQGRLWAAGDPDLFARQSFINGDEKSSPSAVFEITLAGGVPQSATRVYADTDGPIAGADSAALAGRHLLIGSALDGQLMDCHMP